jgi:hypothetical protein
MDLEKLSPKQKEIFKQVWSVCVYFQHARKYAFDSVLAEQARCVGMMLDDFDKEESKKNKSGDAGKAK